MDQQRNVSGRMFTFRKRWSPVDWRTLASIDVDRIARDMDVKMLQDSIVNVTYCNVLSEVGTLSEVGLLLCVCIYHT